MSALVDLLHVSMHQRSLPPGLPSGCVRIVVLGLDDVVVELGPSCLVRRDGPKVADLTLWLSEERAVALLRGDLSEPLRAAGAIELLRSLAAMVAPTSTPLGTRLPS